MWLDKKDLTRTHTAVLFTLEIKLYPENLAFRKHPFFPIYVFSYYFENVRSKYLINRLFWKIY